MIAFCVPEVLCRRIMLPSYWRFFFALISTPVSSFWHSAHWWGHVCHLFDRGRRSYPRKCSALYVDAKVSFLSPFFLQSLPHDTHTSVLRSSLLATAFLILPRTRLIYVFKHIPQLHRLKSCGRVYTISKTCATTWPRLWRKACLMPDDPLLPLPCIISSVK